MLSFFEIRLLKPTTVQSKLDSSRICDSDERSFNNSMHENDSFPRIEL